MPDTLTRKFSGRTRDLGGFEVRRVLPYAKQRMVGPFIFFDQMGPAEFAPGDGIDVRPHPHIGLATVTYLFDGALQHRDSLGEDLVIRPGDVNWMTAGHGVVHSERTPAPERAAGHKMYGIQTWVALPEDKQDMTPAFFHHPADSLPEFEKGGARFRLILGTAWGREAPVAVFSPIFYLHGEMPAGSEVAFDIAHEERAFYVVEGRVRLGDDMIEPGAMAVLAPDETPDLLAEQDSRIMLCGGRSLGPRVIDWNFVGPDRETIDAARKDWTEAARSGFPASGRFRLPEGESEHIPLPE
ncbi:pirin family protein [uncultured Maricaulis sp.]|uniref:pirin family protein n=1 Tax=uncultured Maricaulis sp. TaxID=174710 RepID=UPI00260D4B28|nr:pirin family protein [uncultured Maricaulis sp.]